MKQRNHFAARGGPTPSSPTPTQPYTAIDQADLKKQNVPASSRSGWIRDWFIHHIGTQHVLLSAVHDSTLVPDGM